MRIHRSSSSWFWTRTCAAARTNIYRVHRCSSVLIGRPASTILFRCAVEAIHNEYRVPVHDRAVYLRSWSSSTCSSNPLRNPILVESPPQRKQELTQFVRRCFFFFISPNRASRRFLPSTIVFVFRRGSVQIERYSEGNDQGRKVTIELHVGIFRILQELVVGRTFRGSQWNCSTAGASVSSSYYF